MAWYVVLHLTENKIYESGPFHSQEAAESYATAAIATGKFLYTTIKYELKKGDWQ